MRDLHLVVCGCGTVGLAGVRQLTQGPLAPHLAAVTTVDPAPIRPDNASITCPPYAGHIGRPKCMRLAELAAEWLGEGARSAGVRIRPVVGSVEGLDWPSIPAAGAGGPVASGGAMAVLIGLDNWQSRLCVIEDLRQAASSWTVDTLAVQVGLERDQAQVSVFGPHWDDPCPACGLDSLPQTQRCAVRNSAGDLLRGDLQREVRAAAALVAEVLADWLVARPAPCGWLHTKTSLWAKPAGSAHFRRFTHTAARIPGCFGPHSPHGPLRWQPSEWPLEPVGKETTHDPA